MKIKNTHNKKRKARIRKYKNNKKDRSNKKKRNKRNYKELINMSKVSVITRRTIQHKKSENEILMEYQNKEYRNLKVIIEKKQHGEDISKEIAILQKKFRDIGFFDKNNKIVSYYVVEKK